MSYIFVSSDGEGFRISNQEFGNDIGLRIGNLLGFAVSYYTAKIGRNEDIDAIMPDCKKMLKFVGKQSNKDVLKSKLLLNTYYYSGRSFVGDADESSDDIVDIIDMAIKIVVSYPFEFANYLMMCAAHKPFEAVSAYGVNLFTFDEKYQGLGSYIRSGNDALKLTDSAGNEISLVPKVLRSDPSEVITNLASVDFTYMFNATRQMTIDVRSRIKSLRSGVRETAEREYANGYNAGIKAVSDLPEGWRVGTIPGKMDKYFIWSGEIHPKYVNKNNKVYTLPDEVSALMFLTDIAVPIRNNLENILGKGVFPHCSVDNNLGMTPEKVREKSGWNGLCIGDLNGKSLSRMREILDQMLTINMGSMYGNPSSSAMGILVGDRLYEYDEGERKAYRIDDSGRRIDLVKERLAPTDPLAILYKYSGLHKKRVVNPETGETTGGEVAGGIWRV